MPSRQEIEAAEAKMKGAEAALQRYVERSPDVDTDPALHRRLTEELRAAEAEFLELLK